MIAPSSSPPLHRYLQQLSPPSCPPMAASPLAFPKSYNSTPLHPFPSLQIRRRHPSGFHAAVSVPLPQASIPGKAQGPLDPELRKVLELASDSELYEIERILFGPSYFSPLIKSISSGAEFDHVMIAEDLEVRQNFIEALESRFLYLAADARSTLRGWRPSYRSVLLDVRKELKVPCSSKLSTEDLEIEIFIHLFHEYSAQLKGDAAALRVGAADLQSMLLKGSQVFALLKMSNSVLRRFSSKLLLNAAKSQVKNGFIRKGGQLAMVNSERQVALLAARQGLAGATCRYLAFRSLTSFLGPLMLGTFLADIVIVMLGTDYARVLQAIYAFAQIRILRTYRRQLDEDFV